MSPIGVYVRTKTRVYPVRPLGDRFWPKVQKSDGCWLWVAGGDSATGYGRIRLGRAGTKHELAHRVAWQLTFGPIPDGLWVLHHCDTPRCVRPDHLFLGDCSDNMKDAATKGRMVKGERWYALHPDHLRRPRGLPWTIANGRPRRTKPDPVTAAVRWAVMHRDGACILSTLDRDHVCRDKWGEMHPPTDTRRLTVEHVKSELRMGKRAPSDLGHLVAMCHAGNVGVPSKEQRQAIREYLERINA